MGLIPHRARRLFLQLSFQFVHSTRVSVVYVDVKAFQHIFLLNHPTEGTGTALVLLNLHALRSPMNVCPIMTCNYLIILYFYSVYAKEQANVFFLLDYKTHTPAPVVPRYHRPPLAAMRFSQG